MKTKIVATRIPEKDRDDFFRICKNFKVKPSDILRTAVIDFCDKASAIERSGKIITKNYISAKDKNSLKIKTAKA